jgi:hypothetical protein
MNANRLNLLLEAIAYELEEGFAPLTQRFCNEHNVDADEFEQLCAMLALAARQWLAGASEVILDSKSAVA